MEATLNQTAVKDITMVAISAIHPNGFNPRKHFDETSLNELADSIRQQGMLQPVTVRPQQTTTAMNLCSVSADTVQQRLSACRKSLP